MYVFEPFRELLSKSRTGLATSWDLIRLLEGGNRTSSLGGCFSCWLFYSGTSLPPWFGTKNLGHLLSQEKSCTHDERGTPVHFEMVIPFGLYFLRAEAFLRISSTEDSQIQQHPMNELNSVRVDQNGLWSLLALECYF